MARDVFLFRRDLRAVDNTALDLLESQLGPGEALTPVFAVDGRQADPALNPYHCPHAARFLAESLVDLERQLGRPLVVVRVADGAPYADALWHALAPVRRIAFNRDHTPFARARDAEVDALCAARGVEVLSSTGDHSLVDPAAMPKPYKVFAPFYRRHGPEALAGALSAAARASGAAKSKGYGKGTGAERGGGSGRGRSARLAELCALLGAPHGSAGPGPSPPGGRAPALAILARVRAGLHDGYGSERDALGLDATTRLSPYLKFGCVSAREAMAAAASRGAKLEPLRRQLMFRAFYDQVAYHFPRVLAGQAGGGNRAMRAREGDREMAWRTGAAADADFDAWRRGATGVPLVDAGMRQLEATGFMHNRARMVAASFLVKDLRIDWRRGERHFASRLVDYDPAANSGGWQWVAGCGADASPYVRVFNPWRQAARFDPDGVYVRRWVPELRGVPPPALLDPAALGRARPPAYPPAVVEHAVAARQYLEALGASRSRTN